MPSSPQNKNGFSKKEKPFCFLRFLVFFLQFLTQYDKLNLPNKISYFNYLKGYEYFYFTVKIQMLYFGIFILCLDC